ncbi:HU family DNA-binding protein [Sagittula sp. SSi028]|uniref:HU family DNA-binding protein n=1 Tax=Sagittula sp. SSi028 TaxID=3400636 RepID=UPI003AF79895
MATKRKTTTTRKTTTPKSAPTTANVTLDETIDANEDVLHATTDGGDAVQVEDIPVIPQPEMKKKELVDLAVERSGIKKRDAKPAIEAALAVLGEALAEGRELNLVPLGKLKVTRMKKGGNGQIINARVRQPEGSENSLDDPLAQAAE